MARGTPPESEAPEYDSNTPRIHPEYDSNTAECSELPDEYTPSTAEYTPEYTPSTGATVHPIRPLGPLGRFRADLLAGDIEPRMRAAIRRYGIGQARVVEMFAALEDEGVLVREGRQWRVQATG